MIKRVKMTEIPEISSTVDLVDLGVFHSPRDACCLRMYKEAGPEFVRLPSSRIVYYKKDVVEWLKKQSRLKG